MTMKLQLTTYQRIALIAALLALATVLVAWYTSRTTADLERELRARLDAKELALFELATAAAGGGGSATTVRIIQDCESADREALDALLGRLSTLGAAELPRLSKLFARCGNYHAVEKAVIVSQLEREYAALEEYLVLYAAVTGEALLEYPLDDWQTLIARERDRHELLARLVGIQGELIAGREAGASPNDPATQALLAEAQLVRDGVVTVGQVAATLREALAP